MGQRSQATETARWRRDHRPQSSDRHRSARPEQRDEAPVPVVPSRAFRSEDDSDPLAGERHRHRSLRQPWRGQCRETLRLSRVWRLSHVRPARICHLVNRIEQQQVAHVGERLQRWWLKRAPAVVTVATVECARTLLGGAAIGRDDQGLRGELGDELMDLRTDGLTLVGMSTTDCVGDGGNRPPLPRVPAIRRPPEPRML